MFPQILLRLLTSVLVTACFCQSGFAAVKWEMSWETSQESFTMVPDSDDESRVPTIDFDAFSHSMESHPAAGVSVIPPFLCESRDFDLYIDAHPLVIAEILGQAIRVPWRSLKVPI
jgi:hypothetical protein